MRWRTIPGAAAGWLFAATLFFAPWPFGATPGWAIEGMEWLLAGSFFLWALEGAIRLRAPVFHPALLLLAGALLLLGWSKTGLALGIADSPSGMFSPLDSSLARGFGAVDLSLAREWMVRATCLVGAVLLASDLVADPAWLLRLWSVMAASGTLIAILGLAQKAGGAPGIYWQGNASGQTTFFASFVYHANAGAFLNLCLPLCGGLLIRSFHRPRGGLKRSIWIAATVLTAAACAVNTSRGSQILALVESLALLCWPARRFLLSRWQAREVQSFLYPAILGLLILWIVQTIGWEQSLHRWDALIQKPDAAFGTRLDPLGPGLVAARQAGWTGFGPGSFQVIFPYFTGGFGESLRGYWVYLHNDYVQTVIEWGLLGAALWGLLFFGGLGLSARRQVQLGQRWQQRQKLLASCSVIALCGVALHSSYDFPLQIASIQLYAATLLGVCWGSLHWIAPEPKSRKAALDQGASTDHEDFTDGRRPLL